MVGKPIKELMFWVPQAGEIGLGVSIISYNGQVLLGLIADERVISTPQLVMDAFERQVEELAAQVLAAGGLDGAEPGSAGANGGDMNADSAAVRGGRSAK